MTTYRFHWRPSRKGNRQTGTLFIRIIHNRRFKDIVRPYAIYGDEWDPVNRTVKLATVNPERKFILYDVAASMRDDLSRIESIVYLLSLKGDYSVHEISNEFSVLRQSSSLGGFTAKLQRELSENGQYRTGRAYRSAARSLNNFTGRDISLEEIKPILIRSYEQHLLDSGLQMNTISFYMRNLRAVYYRAVKTGIIAGCTQNPFEDVFTGVYETKRRSLDQKELGRLASLDKDLGKKLQATSRSNTERYMREKQFKDALMYFMFAFHSRGMSFVDLAYLKKSEVYGNTIRYKRKKTGFFIEVKVTKPMKKIIGYFKGHTKNSQYVFPIISRDGHSERLQYEAGLSRQNRLLKELALMAGIGKNLSTHVARHTWATLAKRMGYSIPLISEGLGHRDIKVTSTYLASFERSALDELSTRLSGIAEAA